MKSSRMVALLSAFFLVNAGGLSAADQGRDYALEGPGRMSCATYADTVKAGGEDLKLISSWALGYLTAHNRLMEMTFDLTPWQTPETIMRLMTQFCSERPEATFEAGMQYLIAYLEPQRMQAEAPLVKIGTDGKTVILYKTTLSAARRKLIELGYAPITDDETLAAAVRDFQSKEGLRISGLLDQPTLIKLIPD